MVRSAGHFLAELAVTAQIFKHLPHLDWLHPWLLPHYGMGFADMLRDPILWTSFGGNTLLRGGYVLVSGALVWGRLASKDVLSRAGRGVRGWKRARDPRTCVPRFLSRRSSASNRSRPAGRHCVRWGWIQGRHTGPLPRPSRSPNPPGHFRPSARHRFHQGRCRWWPARR